MRLKTKLVGQTITTMPPKDIRRTEGTPNELMHDAACAHALMLAMDGIRSEWVPDGPPILSEIVTRADELLREWGFDSGEDAS